MPSRNRIKRNWAKHPRYLVKASDFHYMTVPQMSLVTSLRRVTDLTRRVQRTNRDRVLAEGRGARAYRPRRAVQSLLYGCILRFREAPNSLHHIDRLVSGAPPKQC